MMVVYLPLHWDIKVCNVSQTEVNQTLQVILTKVVLEGLFSEHLTFSHGVQAIL
jgi:hypothetical protein